VVIIGAGMSGITAAKQLMASNKNVLILEGRNRTGGRMFTNTDTNFNVELGAGWVQNYNAAWNPTINLYKGYGLTDTSFDWNNANYYNADGSTDVYNDDAVDANIERKIVSAQSSYAISVSMYAAITSFRSWSSLSDYDKAELYTIEDEYGASLSSLSAKYWDTEGGPGYSDSEAILNQGFSALVNKQASGLNIQLNKVVTSVDYSSGTNVKVTTSDGTVYTAGKVIVSVPLGVLKAGKIAFVPALSSSAPNKAAAINRMAMGTLNHMCLQFPTGTLQQFGLGSINYMQKNPSVALQNAYNGRGFHEIITWKKTKGIDAICGEASADFGKALESLNDSQITTLLMNEIRQCVGSNFPNPIAYKFTRWNQDPFSLGSYSYIPVNAYNTDYNLLAASVNNLLFFAGEGTCINYPALVQGAYSSGLREACKVLGNSNCGTC